MGQNVGAIGACVLFVGAAVGDSVGMDVIAIGIEDGSAVGSRLMGASVVELSVGNDVGSADGGDGTVAVQHSNWYRN